jgi:hypothetical protein
MLERLKLKLHVLFRHEFVRLLPLIGLATLLLLNKAESGVVLLNIGIIAAVVAVSHFTRKLLFPYIDLEKFANKAMEEPLPAAIIFLSVSYLLSMILEATLKLVS